MHGRCRLQVSILPHLDHFLVSSCAQSLRLSSTSVSSNTLIFLPPPKPVFSLFCAWHAAITFVCLSFHFIGTGPFLSTPQILGHPSLPQEDFLRLRLHHVPYFTVLRSCYKKLISQLLFVRLFYWYWLLLLDKWMPLRKKTVSIVLSHFTFTPNTYQGTWHISNSNTYLWNEWVSQGCEGLWSGGWWPRCLLAADMVTGDSALVKMLGYCYSWNVPVP